MIRFVLRYRQAISWRQFLPWCLLFLLLLPGLRLSAAEPRVDVFPGYSSQAIARLGTHYPITVELQGNGPTIKGHLEFSTGNGGHPLRVPIELPSGTIKRLIVPAFANSQNGSEVTVRLYSESGKLIVERPRINLMTVAPESVIVGVLPAQVQSAPGFPEQSSQRAVNDLKPVAVRLDAGMFPDTSLALEGLNALYLNSRRALDLKEPQYAALQTWVASGGHLILSIENSTDVTATGWLREMVPAKVEGASNIPLKGIFYRFIASSGGPGRGTLQYPTQPVWTSDASSNSDGTGYSSLVLDEKFENASTAVIGLAPLPGAELLLVSNKKPLAIAGRYGRGLVTALAFNLEQEPFRSWKHRGWFFARWTSVPESLLKVENSMNLYGGQGIDGVFGGMIGTRQVKKLPVGILLLLLLVYLAVIGPFDQWWLKKINRPMLTWITFPTYVVLFSLLIYFIGFKLRSGQTEYSELQVVDVIPRGSSGDAVLRGRSFATIYSPANDTYKLSSELPVAQLRGEFRSGFGFHNDAGKMDVALQDKGFRANAYVPVWTHQNYVGDWSTETDAPISAQWTDGRLSIKSAEKKFTKVIVVHSGKRYELGALGAGGELTYEEDATSAGSLQQLTQSWDSRFSTVVQNRDQTFGTGIRGDQMEHINEPDWPEAIVAASFCGKLTLNHGGNQRNWMWGNGFDLSHNESRGDAIIFAWMADDTLLPTMNQFKAIRGTKSTMVRLVAPQPNKSQ